MMSQMSHTKAIAQISTQLNHTKQVMSGMTSCTIFENHSSWEFMELQLTGMGKYAQELLTYQEISSMMHFVAPEQLRCL